MGKKQDEFYSSADMALEFLRVVEKNTEAYVDTIIRQKNRSYRNTQPNYRKIQ